MEYNKYGYIRVSSKDQNVDRQITALKEVGLTGSQLYIDYQSGKDFNRPHYQKLLQVLNREIFYTLNQLIVLDVIMMKSLNSGVILSRKSE